MIYGNDPTPFVGCVVLHPSADSTPAPWGPPEGLGLQRMHYLDSGPLVLLIDAGTYEWDEEVWNRRHADTPGAVMDIYVHNRVDLVPPIPGGES